MKYTISASGLVSNAQVEGIVLGPYQDERGIWTYGVGSTKFGTGQDPATMPKIDTRKWTKEQVTNELRRIFERYDTDLDQYEARVNAALRGVELKQHQFDALVGWDFNTGGATWRGSSGQEASLIRQIKAGDMSGGTDSNGFFGWLKPPSLKGRRTKERNLFRHGDYHLNERITVYDAAGDGRALRRFSLSAADLLDMLRQHGFGKVKDRPPIREVEFALPDLIAMIINAILKAIGVKR